MIKVVVISADLGDEEILLQNEGLLRKPESTVLEIDSFISSIIKATANGITSSCNLRIEIGGEIYIAKEAGSGQKIVCFNVFNKEELSQKQGLMKLTLETEVAPAPVVESSTIDSSG